MAILLSVSILAISTTDCFNSNGPSAELLKMTTENATFADLLKNAANELPNTSKVLHPGTSVGEFAEFFSDWIRFIPILSNTGTYSDDFSYLSSTASGHGLYQNLNFSRWVKYFIDTRGEFMDSPCSLGTIATWEKDVPDMDEFAVPEGGFTTFNNFFTREFKNRTKSRPFDTRNTIIPAPCDAVPIMIHTNLSSSENYLLKSDIELNVSTILKNYPTPDEFIGGQLLRLVLMPDMYHRMHAPFDSIVKYVHQINGSYYDINNINEEYECRRRAVVVLQHATNSDVVVALVPLGFATISSILMNASVFEGALLKQGDHVAHFQYGGSTVAMLFSNKTKMTFTVPTNNTTERIQLGQSVGYLSSV